MRFADHPYAKTGRLCTPSHLIARPQLVLWLETEIHTDGSPDVFSHDQFFKRILRIYPEEDTATYIACYV